DKKVLARCSVFAGGFNLHSACAVAGSADLDEYVVLEVLDALVRKSLLVADQSASRTRFSMLGTIRQFAEEQLVADEYIRRHLDGPLAVLRRTGSRHHGPVEQPAPA
ncbi:MAG: hypothetical protein K2X97_22480, partial [Mycobacteriaceae bacterium]|nr:hypothetical protein [Mycobacteriaceae bacterium]